MSEHRRSQCDRILALITSYGEFGCPLPEIMKLGIACHTKRIHELRQQGHLIECWMTTVDGIRHSLYKYHGQLAKGNAA